MIEVPIWSIVAALILITIMGLALVGSFYFGYYRGSTLAVRSIRLIAMLYIATPAALIVVKNVLEVDIKEYGWDTAFVVASGFICLTAIDIAHLLCKNCQRFVRQVDESGAVVDLQQLVFDIVEDLIQQISEQSGERKSLDESVLRAVVFRQYPDDKVHQSPNIVWPSDFSYVHKWGLIVSLSSAFATRFKLRIDPFVKTCDGLMVAAGAVTDQ